MSVIPLHSVTPTDTIRTTLEETLVLQRAAYFAHPYPSFAERKADLLKLKAFIQDNRDAIVDAISAATADTMEPLDLINKAIND